MKNTNYPPPRMQRAVDGLVKDYMKGRLAHMENGKGGGPGCAVCSITRSNGGNSFGDAWNGKADTGYSFGELAMIEASFENRQKGKAYKKPGQDTFPGLCDVFDTLIELDPYPEVPAILIGDTVEVAL